MEYFPDSGFIICTDPDLDWRLATRSLEILGGGMTVS